MEQKTYFVNKLMEWGSIEKRPMPWKNERDPYRIWLSEVILQQTRVAQGLEYYNQFIAEFPTIFDLAAADVDKVMKLWQGLGYYSRARNLHFAANQIVDKYDGAFPTDIVEIKKLKGIGDYTAAAVLSFAFNLPYAVVDGNVYRVLSRFFNIELPIDSTDGIKYFKTLAQELIPSDNARLYNQAIMDFGALICKPKLAQCLNCNLSAQCQAYQLQKVEKLPIKEKKITTKFRYLHYLHLMDENGSTFMKQRLKQDIWQLLYEFPLLETDEELTQEVTVASTMNWLSENSIGAENQYDISQVTQYYKHQLTHQKLFV
ncbi:MAG: A/G-specific adenine glycosylase, partial [Saprospiraceae bacterium]|nr:A/G-specific adenine glycosylase [Saprospiraceae bacterium]